MNIPLSLLIYNPIEAYTLILLCDVITGKDFKYNLKRVHLLYVFSFINFLNQLVPYIWYDEGVFILLNILTGYIVTPVLLKAFCNAMSFDITLRECFVAQFISCIFIIITSSLFNVVFHTNNVYYNYNDLYEFIVNLAIFAMQISLYKIIKHRRYIYEKLCKGNRK